MAVIKPKRTTTVGKVPTTTDLADGEVALNLADKKLFARNGASVVEIGASTASGPMNSAYTSGATGTLGTAEAQIASVTLNVKNAGSKVLLIARAGLTKDTGTTARTATLRIRAGTTNTDVQVGTDSKIASSTTASSAYAGVAAILGEHAPGAAGNVTYSLRGLVGAGASTVSGYELEAVELTGAKGDKGDPGAPLTGATAIAVVATLPSSPDASTIYMVTG